MFGQGNALNALLRFSSPFWLIFGGQKIAWFRVVQISDYK